MMLAAPLAQVLLVNRSPWGGPDLVTLVVVAAALTRGPVWGCLAGLVAGLAADVTPPADGTLGRTALVLAVTGLLVGLAKRGRTVPAVAGAVPAVVVQAVAAVALGDEAWDTAVAGLPLTAAWTAGFALAIGALAGRRPPRSRRSWSARV